MLVIPLFVGAGALKVGVDSALLEWAVYSGFAIEALLLPAHDDSDEFTFFGLRRK